MEQKMKELEKKFDQELIQKSEKAQKQCDYNPARFIQTVTKFGGVKTAKEIMRKGKVSEGFDKLQQAGLIALTMEATLIDKKYADLFTDDEVNSCYELLCEYGYYK